MLLLTDDVTNTQTSLQGLPQPNSTAQSTNEAENCAALKDKIEAEKQKSCQSDINCGVNISSATCLVAPICDIFEARRKISEHTA